MSRATNRFASFSLAALFLASAVLPISIGAQSLPGTIEPVTMTVSPSSPRPNSTITASLESFSVDLVRSDITWYVNGKSYKTGKGETSISFKVGAPGSSSRVSANVSTPDLGIFTVESVVRPAQVVVVWKSDGSIPPFYKGKALESYGGSFRATAIPEFFTTSGKRIDPKTLVYTWSKNGTVDATQSGYGKDSFTDMQSSYIRGGDDVTVTVSNADGTLTSTRTITISPVVAEVSLYQDSPLYGPLFERELPGYLALTEEEVTLRVEPFHMSNAQVPGSLSLTWTMNGSPLSEWANKKAITLRRTGDSTGQSEVGVSLQHVTRMLQAGQASITIYQ